MAGELMTVHPPEVVRRLTLPQARAILTAVYAARHSQAETLAQILGAT